jgi:hypothetical protein
MVNKIENEVHKKFLDHSIYECDERAKCLRLCGWSSNLDSQDHLKRVEILKEQAERT